MISVVKIEQVFQVPDTAFHVLRGIEGIGHTKPARGGRHQLHEAECSFV